MSLYTYSEELSFSWDSWAQSDELLEYDGYFEFSVHNSSGVVCGISPDGILKHNSKIAHGFFIEGSAYRIIENGITLGVQMSFSGSDRFRIERSGSQVLYFKNDALLRETQVSYFGPSRLYAAMYGYFDNVTDAVMVITTSEAEADSSLPAFKSQAFTDHFSFSASDLPGYSGTASSADTSTVVSVLPGLKSVASTDDVTFCASTLPAFSGFSEQGALTPDVTSSMSVLPFLASEAGAEDSPWIDSTLPGIGAIGLALNEGEDTNVAIGLEFLPAYTSSSGVFAESWLEVEIPFVNIVQFQTAPALSGKLFILKGLLEGSIFWGSVDGRLAKIRGVMDTGGQMDGQLALLQGKAFGSTGVSGDVGGQLPVLHGQMSTGSQLDGSLVKLRGSLSGSECPVGVIDGKVFGLNGRLNAEPAVVGLLSGRAFSVQGQAVAVQESTGSLGGQVGKLAGQMAGTVSESASISGKLSKLRGKMTGAECPVGVIAGLAYQVFGDLSQTTFSGTHVTMRYTRK